MIMMRCWRCDDTDNDVYSMSAMVTCSQVDWYQCQTELTKGGWLRGNHRVSGWLMEWPWLLCWWAEFELEKVYRCSKIHWRLRPESVIDSFSNQRPISCRSCITHWLITSSSPVNQLRSEHLTSLDYFRRHSHPNDTSHNTPAAQ